MLQIDREGDGWVIKGDTPKEIQVLVELNRVVEAATDARVRVGRLFRHQVRMAWVDD